MRQPRGERNNNPGNIRKSAAAWRGAVGDDGVFVRFESPFYGLRALAKLLRNYSRLYKLSTVSAVIARFAPSVENDTVAYVASVSKALGVSENAQLNIIESDAQLCGLVRAVVMVECGRCVYSDAEILAAVRGI